MVQLTIRVLLLLAAGASAAEMTFIEQQLQKTKGRRDVARETLKMVYDHCAPLKDLTTTNKGVPITVPKFPNYTIGPCVTARRVARTYMERAGLSYNPDRTHHKVDTEFAQRVASWFDSAEHKPKGTDPAVDKAYSAMIRETIAQWEVIQELTGLHVEFIKDRDADEDLINPYQETPRMAVADIVLNNRFYCFSTEDGFGSEDDHIEGNPLEEPAIDSHGQPIMIDGRVALANDIFRIVHDYFGHVKEGCGFRAAGEDNAWRQHAAMFSEEALPAVTAETRGQNSWVNFGPHGKENQHASQGNTKYATQKCVAAPEWVMKDALPYLAKRQPLPVDTILKVVKRPAEIQLQRFSSSSSTDYPSSWPSSPDSDSSEKLL